jgi:hypothetical protein
MSSRTFSVLAGLVVGVAMLAVLQLLNDPARDWVTAVAGVGWLTFGVVWVAGRLYDRVFPRPE